MMALVFADPTWLNMVWFSSFLLLGAWVVESYRFKKILRTFSKKLGEFLLASVSYTKKRWHLVLQCLALAFMALAMARPQMGMRQQEIKQTGVEMIIAVDVSNSMLAEDDKPSRLEHAKHEIVALLDRMTGDRVGLIAFAGSAVLVSPMTSDYSALKIFIDSLTPESVSSQGTNFKDVIDEASQAFERGGVEGMGGAKPTRVLLIASDGEDQEPGAQGEIKKALDAGIRIFTLGFGTASGAPIPLRDDRGNLRGYKKDKTNQVIMSVPSEEGLIKLARSGGGAYYHSTFDGSELKLLQADIDKLQKTDFKSKMSTDYDEKFQIPLFIAFIIALIDFCFGDRKAPGRKWRGRFEGAA